MSDILSLVHLELEIEENTPSYKSTIVSHLKNKFQTLVSQESSKEFLLSMLNFSLNYLNSYPLTELDPPDMKVLSILLSSFSNHNLFPRH